MPRPDRNDWIPIAAAAVFAGGGGLALGLWLGTEGDDLRAWLSALSGWIAAIVAGVIGLVTLGPIARQAQAAQKAYNIAAYDRLLKAKRDVDRIKKRLQRAVQILINATSGKFFFDTPPKNGWVHPQQVDTPCPATAIQVLRFAKNEIGQAINQLGDILTPHIQNPALPDEIDIASKLILDLYADAHNTGNLIEIDERRRLTPENSDRDDWNAYIKERAEHGCSELQKQGSSFTVVATRLLSVSFLLDNEIEKLR